METAKRTPTLYDCFLQLLRAGARLTSFGRELKKLARDLEQGKPVNPQKLKKLGGQLEWWGKYNIRWSWINWDLVNGRNWGQPRLPLFVDLRGRFDTGEVWLNDKPLALAPSLKLINHSPTGFGWGYGGSGPSQLALAVLLEVSGDEKWALEHYQQFKWDLIAKLPQADFDMWFHLRSWLKGEKWYPEPIGTRGKPLSERPRLDEATA